MSSQRPHPSTDGSRIVICDYNALLLSVTGLLRMSGYCVFQAHDGFAAEELCVQLPRIDLLVLNTYGTGIDTGDLIRRVRAVKTGLPVLHIGAAIPDGLPADVPTLPEVFTPARLLRAVSALIDHAAAPGSRGTDPGALEALANHARSGSWEDRPPLDRRGKPAHLSIR